MPPSSLIENPSTIGRLGSALWRGWDIILQACFAALCLRFVAAALRETAPDIWPTLTLAIGTFVLAVWRPRPALYAFTLFAALLIGLRQSTLLTVPSPPALVFSALWLGTLARKIGDLIGRDRGAAVQLAPAHRALALACSILVTCLFLSLLAQIWPMRSKSEFWSVFLSRATFSFGDPYYFLGSAFLWLQGFFYFRLLVAPSGASHLANMPSAANDAAAESDHNAPSLWINAYFSCLTATIIVSLLFQAITHVPTKPGFFAGLPLQSSLPFEDWHTFGSIAAALFAYSLLGWTKLGRTPRILIASILLIMVISSWSRAAWMGAVIALLIVVGRRLPFRLSVSLIALALGSILALHLARSDRWTVDHNPILYRLSNLTRIDQPRLDLYHKAIGMIKDRPFLGHGIGSSYRTSVNYARPGDPLAAKPDFMHNFLLQIAAEQGLLVMSLLAGLILFILWNGLFGGTRHKIDPPDRQQSVRWDALLALTTYLITQLTANSLNIYISNQFFFWFVAATSVAVGQSTKGTLGQPA